MKYYMIYHHYRDGSEGGVLPFLVDEREKKIILSLENAVLGFNQEIEFVEQEDFDEREEGRRD